MAILDWVGVADQQDVTGLGPRRVPKEELGIVDSRQPRNRKSFQDMSVGGRANVYLSEKSTHSKGSVGIQRVKCRMAWSWVYLQGLGWLKDR